MKKLAIILLNWNGEIDTVDCIKSIYSHHEKDLFDIFILDNFSEEKSINYICDNLSIEEKLSLSDFIEKANDKVDFKRLNLICSDKNLGFAKGNNTIHKYIYELYEYVILLNNDTVMIEESLLKMLNCMDINTDVGILSTDIKLFSDTSKRWNAGGYFTIYGDRKYYGDKFLNNKNLIDTEFVTGCIMMIRSSIIKKVGFFTEKFFFGEEDFNYCLRLKVLNIKVCTLLTTSILHKVGTSAKKLESVKDNRYILHFTNRIIDLRDFYSNYYWFIWKNIYLTFIFIHSIIRSHDFSLSISRVKRIHKYSKLQKIDKDIFEEIMSLK